MYRYWPKVIYDTRLILTLFMDDGINSYRIAPVDFSLKEIKSSYEPSIIPNSVCSSDLCLKLSAMVLTLKYFLKWKSTFAFMDFSTSVFIETGFTDTNVAVSISPIFCEIIQRFWYSAFSTRLRLDCRFLLHTWFALGLKLFARPVLGLCLRVGLLVRHDLLL